MVFTWISHEVTGLHGV